MMDKSLRTVFRALAVTGLLSMTAFTPAACASRPCSEQAVPGLAIAVGARSNSPEPVVPQEVRGEIDKIITATEEGDIGKGITFIRVDGAPTIACGIQFDASAKNDIAKRDAKTKFVVAVSDTAVAVRAREPEVDILGALDLAAASAAQGGTVVLIDSGMQTKEPLNFVRPGMLDADSDAVVDALAKTNVLPDLHYRKLILVGIGYTAPPQKPLDEARRKHLIELWKKIGTEAGATSVVPVDAPNTKESPARLPAVTEVPVPDPDPIDVGCNKTFIFTNDSSVGFQPESTTFKDPRKARGVLFNYGDWLKKNATARATVTGSIAHYGNGDEGNSGLSRARAETVREVLIEVGARAGQVVAVGEGWGPEPTKDAPPDPASDQLNRRVVIELSCS